MNHLSEDELILHYYKEADAPAHAARHLAECAECAEQLAALTQVLLSIEAAPVPERGADYGAQVWQRIQSQVIARQPKRSFAWRDWFGMRQLAMAGTMAVLVVAAYLAGVNTGRENAPPLTGNAQQVRERILLVAVGEHIERSRMVLVELMNSPGTGNVDLTTTQAWASDLVESNRLYRQTAMRSGDPGTAGVLEELERVLLEVAHSPEELSQSELDLLRQRIEAKGIIFKLRVLETQMQKRTEQAQPKSGTAKS